MNILAIRQALSDQLEAVIGEGFFSPLPLPQTSVQYPAITVLLQPGRSIVYQETMGDIDPDLLLDVEIVVRGDVVAAQERLSRYLSTGDTLSIVDAVNSDTTLGGAVMSIQAAEATIAEPPTERDGEHIALVHFRVYAG